jgi:hypothetical protein
MFNAFSLGDRELKVNTAKAREERGGYKSQLGAFGSGGGPRGHSRRGGSRRY